MNLKIAGQSTESNYKNTDSSVRAVYYNEHDLREFLNEALKLGASDRQMRYFDMDGHVVTAAEVMDKIDRHRSGLHKDDAKFYCLMIDPSDSEIAAMGTSLAERLANGQQYVFDVMDAYARTFNREGINDRHNLTAYAIPNLYKGDDKKEQIHWHIVVGRKDRSNKFKLSPLTNHRGTEKGAVKGGFDRVAFDRECERLFDVRFDYERKVEESFDYCLAQKKGTPEQKAEQTQKLSEQNKPDLEAAVKAFLDQRVAQLAAEATARAIAEQKAKETAAREEAARIERANKNSYWNAYNSHYKPLITDAKKICNTSFELFDKYKRLDKDCSQAISSQYNMLRVKYAEMDRLDDDVRNASTAKDIVTAVATLIAFVNPLLGIAVGLVGRIVAEASRSASLDARRDIRADAAAIRDDIEDLKEKQQRLRKDKTDALKVYLRVKEDKTALFAEMNNLRDELLKPIELPKPKITFDFMAAAQKASQPQATHPMRATNVQSSVDIYGTMMNAANQHGFTTTLLTKMVSVEPVLDRYGGVSDFRITLAREGRVTNASGFVSSEQLRFMLDKWGGWTGQRPAYKLAIERDRRTKLEDICRKLDKALPNNGPRIPRDITISSDGRVQSVSYVNSKGKNITLNVDADNYIRWNNGAAINIMTGRYYEAKPKIQQEESTQTDKITGIKVGR